MMDEAFNLVLKELAASLEQDLLTSDPHETKRRESLYFQHRGLQAICATLATWVEIGENTHANVMEENRQKGLETE